MFRARRYRCNVHGSLLAMVSCILFVAPQPGWLPQSRAQPPRVEEQRPRVDIEILSSPDEPNDRAAKQGRLSVGQLIETAMQNNPAIGVAIGRVDAARGQWLQAGLPPNPVIGYRGEDIGAKGTSGQQGGFVSRRFVRGGKLRLARAAAEEQIEKARWQLESSRQRVVNDVKAGYYDVLIAQRRLDVSESLVKLADDAVRVTRILMQRGETNEVDWRQARVEASMSNLKLSAARGAHTTAWRRLAAVMGTPRMPLTDLIDDMKNGVPRLDYQTVLRRTLEESPQMAAALAEVQRAQWQLRREQAEPIPDVDVQLGVNHDATLGDTLANVELSIQLPLRNANQGSIMRALGEYRAAQNEVRRVELGLHQQLAETFGAYERARYTTIQYTTKILPEAETALDLVIKGFEAGQIDYLRQIIARRTYSETRFGYIEALSELRKASVQIEGFLLSGSLKSGN